MMMSLFLNFLQGLAKIYCDSRIDCGLVAVGDRGGDNSNERLGVILIKHIFLILREGLVN